MQKKTRVLEFIILGFLFFTPRFIFLHWLTHDSSVYQDQSVSTREPSAMSDGGWSLLAKDFLEGKSGVLTSDDIGFPLLMSGLARLGISLRNTFYVACFLAMAVSFLFLYFLFLYLKKNLDKRIATILFLFLALYPPGIYFGFALVARMLPVYAFLVSIVVLIYDRELFSALSLKRLILFLGISIFANFLVLARNTNKVIFLSLLVALALRIFQNKLKIKPYLVFLFIFLGGSILARNLFPRLEHSTWHPIYLGLGDFDNKYQIRMVDSYAQEKAREANPNLRSVTTDIDLHPEYEPTLKKLTLDLISNDPLWYARILTMRFFKITLLPFQGSWLMSLSETKRKEMVELGKLVNGFSLIQYRLYIVLGFITGILDFSLTLLGGGVLFFILVKKSWRETMPWLFILAGTSYVYVLVMISNRSIFLAATYFYEFFAVLFLSRLAFILWDQAKSNTLFKSSFSKVVWNACIQSIPWNS